MSSPSSVSTKSFNHQIHTQMARRSIAAIGLAGAAVYAICQRSVALSLIESLGSLALAKLPPAVTVAATQGAPFWAACKAFVIAHPIVLGVVVVGGISIMLVRSYRQQSEVNFHVNRMSTKANEVRGLATSFSMLNSSQEKASHRTQVEDEYHSLTTMIEEYSKHENKNIREAVSKELPDAKLYANHASLALWPLAVVPFLDIK